MVYKNMCIYAYYVNSYIYFCRGVRDTLLFVYTTYIVFEKTGMDKNFFFH